MGKIMRGRKIKKKKRGLCKIIRQVTSLRMHFRGEIFFLIVCVQLIETKNNEKKRKLLRYKTQHFRPGLMLTN